jgi:formylglycine-generating enzyme
MLESYQGSVEQRRGPDMKTNAPLAAVAVAWAAALIAACANSDSPNTPAAKDEGAEGGACYPSATCNAGLTCVSNVCVNPGTGGWGGDASVGGSAGSAGWAGSAGTSGSGVGGAAGVAGSSAAAGSGGVAGHGGVGAAGGGCPNCGSLEQCWNNQRCAAKLVPIPAGYSIDSTEVTRDQYAAWLETSPATAGQEPWCASNTSYTPRCEWPPSTKGKHPVVCVDWCDASAYCKAVGKRLCGKIGGGTNGYTDYANASLSQWYNACSANGQNEYPFGSTYSGKTCNGNDNGVGSTVEVGSLAGCQSSVSGYAGVYDLSGNVWEWEDSCTGNSGVQDSCRVRGGSFGGDYDWLRCANGAVSGGRTGDVANRGFRCCSP